MSMQPKRNARPITKNNSAAQSRQRIAEWRDPPKNGRYQKPVTLPPMPWEENRIVAARLAPEQEPTT